MLPERLRSYFAIRVRKDWNYRRRMETGAAMRWLKPEATDTVLDIGCGNGTYDFRIARRSAGVIGFDLNRGELLKAARNHASRRVVYLASDAHAMPVAQGAFDIVLSLCVFEHLPDDLQVLAESHRALRPGGRLLITLDSLSLPGVPQAWRDRHMDKHAVQQFYTVPAIESKLQKKGFRLTRSRYLMSSPVDLHLIRLSYATEEMGGILAFIVRTFLITAGRMVSGLANAISRREHGWTLMIEAEKA